MNHPTISESLQAAIIGYYSDSLTQAQADELLVWLEHSEKNRKYLHDLGRLWNITGSLRDKEFNADRALSAAREKICERGFRKPSGRQVRIRLSGFYKLVASLILLTVLAISAYLILTPSRPAFDGDKYFEAFAPKGSRSFILMPDGTNIWLNADTRLRYNAEFGKSTRDVFLDGEAFFEVEKNTDIPFKVITSDISITALGTSFNVKSYKDENTIETTLEEGLLRIEPLKPSKGMGKTGPVTLEPNQNAVFVKNTGTEAMEIVTDVTSERAEISQENEPVTDSDPESLKTMQIQKVADTKLYTSWKDQRWIIKNERLIELAPKLERRFDVNIIFMSTNLEDFAITATLLEEPIEQVLQAMSLSTPIKFEVKSKNVYLYEDPELMSRYKEILNP